MTVMHLIALPRSVSKLSGYFSELSRRVCDTNSTQIYDELVCLKIY